VRQRWIFWLAGVALCTTTLWSIDCAAQVLNFRLGNPNASVTIVEYASLTCPHCRDWDVNALPELLTRFVQTGIAQYELREDLTQPGAAMGESGFIVARCAAANGGYFKVVHQLMTTYPDATDTLGTVWLEAGGEAGGLTASQVLACLGDRRNWDDFVARHNVNSSRLSAYSNAVHIPIGVPAVFVNGVWVSSSPDAVAQAIERAR
jgi:protein-disulfide isomerase